MSIEQELKNHKIDKVEVLQDVAEKFLNLEEMQELVDNITGHIHKRVLEEGLCPACYTEMVYENFVAQDYGERRPTILVCPSCRYAQDL